MELAALLISMPGGKRCHLLLVRGLASLMRCSALCNWRWPSERGRSHQSQASFPWWPGCWTRAQGRLGDVLHSLGRRGGECGSTQPPSPAPPPQPPPPSWVWRCCCGRVKDASSQRWSSGSSWAPGSSSYHGGTITALYPQNPPLKPVHDPSPATDEQKLCNSSTKCSRRSTGMGKAQSPKPDHPQ